MTRAQAIAERIRGKVYASPNVSEFDRGAEHALEELAKGLEAGVFDDLLGPEVTAEILGQLIPEGGEQAWRDRMRGARDWASIAGHCSRRGDVAGRDRAMALAMRYRRLAKWMRRLERSVGT